MFSLATLSGIWSFLAKGTFLRKVLLSVANAYDQTSEDIFPLFWRYVSEWARWRYIVPISSSSPKEMSAECRLPWNLKVSHLHKCAQPYHKWGMLYTPSNVIRIKKSVSYVSAMAGKGHLPAWAFTGIGLCLSIWTWARKGKCQSFLCSVYWKMAFCENC